MTATTRRFTELAAPANWRVVDFISDLHLQAGEPATAQTWQDYLARTSADAVFMLGDLFEVWVGDDGLNTPAPAAGSAEAFEQTCTHALRAASRQRALFFMHGNRDFLAGTAFAQASGVTLLEDPSVLVFAGQRWLLSHGDALCLGDVDYQRFRQQVRTPAWQQAFLARPLSERRAFARQLRDASETRKRGGGADYADADPALTQAWLEAANAATLIHGHTHRPADHHLPPGRLRRVLSDWDASARPPRAEVLRLRWAGPNQTLQVLRLPAEDAR